MFFLVLKYDPPFVLTTQNCYQRQQPLALFSSSLSSNQRHQIQLATFKHKRPSLEPALSILGFCRNMAAPVEDNPLVCRYEGLILS